MGTEQSSSPPCPCKQRRDKDGAPGPSLLLIFLSYSIVALRKLLFIAVLIPILAGLGWWYFREPAFPDYGPAFREYAYVSNGKSNTVSVIDMRTFELAKTLHVGSEPTGIAANSKKNEIYVVNSGSSNVSVIDAETNAVVATIGVHGHVPTSSMLPPTAPAPTWPIQDPRTSASSISKSER